MAPPGPRPTAAARDAFLVSRLACAEAASDEHWSFQTRGKSRAIFQYPAMMVPEMQRQLMEAVLAALPSASSVVDPFAGSGTVQSEAMELGLAVTSQDINPLATLICMAKAQSLSSARIVAAGEDVVKAASVDRSAKIRANFPGAVKWFRPAAAVQLSRLRRAINSHGDIRTRRFLWVVLAETARLTCNSRTSTYKLHARPEDQVDSLPQPVHLFERLNARCASRQAEFVARLLAGGHLRGDRYAHGVSVRLADSSKEVPGQHDLLVTSPPYGDNTTTVPYGQASYLPLCWVELDDIGPQDLIDGLLANAYATDRVSLGGMRVRGTNYLQAPILEQSPALAHYIESIRQAPRDRVARVTAFAIDLDRSIGKMMAALKAEGYAIVTIGNRRVAGRLVPLDRIFSELVRAEGGVFVGAVRRMIRGKKMANRNAISETMSEEITMVFRRAQVAASA